MIGAATAGESYFDFQGLSELKREARQDDGDSLQKTAQLFESLFLQMMLKSMREATFGGGLLDSQQVKFYQNMFDQQLTTSLSTSERGIGLAEVLVRQLQQQRGLDDGGSNEKAVNGPIRMEKDAGNGAAGFLYDPVQVSLKRTNSGPAVPAAMKPESGAGEAPTREAAAALNKPERQTGDAPQQSPKESFVRSLWPHAVKAAEKLGVMPEILIAQAALETGWGKAIINRSDGSSSFNLFAIKANQAWKGESTEQATTEFLGGKAMRTKDAFRAYESYEESFQDYVNFLKSNSRYSRALQVGGDPHQFSEELQKAGYATDPQYSNKIKAILNSDRLQSMSAELKSGAQRTII